jgi:hypothetical protein
MVKRENKSLINFNFAITVRHNFRQRLLSFVRRNSLRFQCWYFLLFVRFDRGQAELQIIGTLPLGFESTFVSLNGLESQRRVIGFG